uniref:LamG-like jellyroll fold domain-containing protein n=1 Tax=viral metagenome TaxID=1070528 RepID=A0A6C0LX20_9ZZZZ
MYFKKITQNKNFLTIILVICSISLLLLIIKIYLKFQYNINKYMVKSKPIYAKKPYTIPKQLISPNINGYEFTYSLWIYVNDWNYKRGKPKHIFHIGDKDAFKTCPGVWINPSNNDISIKFNNKDNEQRYTDGKIGKVDSGEKCIFPYKWNWEKMGISKPKKITNELKNLGITNISHIPNTIEIQNCETTIDKYSKTGYCVTKTDENSYSKNIGDFGSCNLSTMNLEKNIHLLEDDDICSINNIPLKQWFHLTINIHETTINVYMNGLLYKSCPLENIPKFNKGDLYITQNGGFDGMISQFRIFPKSITHQDIYTIYSRGPNNDNHLMKFPNLNICHLCSKL